MAGATQTGSTPPSQTPGFIPARTGLPAAVTEARLPPAVRQPPLTPAARAEILAGLRRQPKMISPKYLYDTRGSELFEQICALPEYYPPRAEMAAMRLHLAEICACLTRDGAKRVTLIEPGAGAGTKVRILLDQDIARAYVAVDISQAVLRRSSAALRVSYPRVDVQCVWGDFTRPLPLPMETTGAAPDARRIVYFPGSTIGNFTREEAVALLERFRAIAGPDGGLLIGVDLLKPPAILLPAYNDAAGVTAMFNLNLLYRLNRECGAEFRPELFAHRAVWDEAHHRIEMRLISRRRQRVRVGPVDVRFEEGEYIITENSHKPSREEFAGLAEMAGLEVKGFWTDPRRLFSVQYLEPRISS